MGWNEEHQKYRTYKTDNPIFEGHEPVEYQGEAGVVEGLFEGVNYYPAVDLKGQKLGEMWKTLGYGDQWDNRGTLWDSYQDAGQAKTPKQVATGPNTSIKDDDMSKYNWTYDD